MQIGIFMRGIVNMLEKYNKNGQHQGSIDPETGKQTKPPVKERKGEP